MFICFYEPRVPMIRSVVILTMLLFLVGAIHAAETNVSNSTSQTPDMNLTNLTNSTNTTGTFNQTDENATPALKTEKPVYKQMIGSILPADFKDPEPRTFTSSGC